MVCHCKNCLMCDSQKIKLSIEQSIHLLYYSFYFVNEQKETMVMKMTMTMVIMMKVMRNDCGENWILADDKGMEYRNIIHTVKVIISIIFIIIIFIYCSFIILFIIIVFIITMKMVITKLLLMVPASSGVRKKKSTLRYKWHIIIIIIKRSYIAHNT